MGLLFNLSVAEGPDFQAGQQSHLWRDWGRRLNRSFRPKAVNLFQPIDFNKVFSFLCVRPTYYLYFLGEKL
jgi:hypothetical protein